MHASFRNSHRLLLDTFLTILSPSSSLRLALRATEHLETIENFGMEGVLVFSIYCQLSGHLLEHR